ncbi:MAG: hypothetical protein G01um1014106_90 [Parcubacteria group bacterium Gr01-1014_106]|nr:MAG: hypothetical protein G01um1014106_90 [Parcubacteria group bacterium Gr01-1014_106]
MNVDWNEVVAMNPQGYVELNNGQTAIHGPLKSIRITDEDFVEIHLKWRAQVSLDALGLPEGNWKVAPNDKPIIFPNLAVPYEVENTPTKGKRVRFRGTNILYIDAVEGLDPARVEGLELPPA